MATKRNIAKRTPTKTARAAQPTQANRSKANKWANIQVPEGFKPITAGEYGEPWDPETMPVLVGQIVGDIREVETGTKQKPRTSQVVSIMSEEDGRMYDVWESAALKGWFERIADGMRVSVVFQGYRDVGKQSPMKVMIGSIAEEDLPDDDAPARPAAKRAAAKRGRR